MGPAKEPEAVGGVLKDLNLNEEEVGKFEKAFKDPTFLQMFSEYAKEITDPKSRAENDLYIRQLEKEGRAEATFGKGVELVTPEAQSVVKTKRAGTSETVYINICTSPKVEVAIGRRAEKAAENAPRGMHWDIPLMMSTQRAGTDKRGKPCSVYDLVIHPDTLRMADANARFKDIVVESAMEKVERTASCKLVRAWRPCRIRYKATPGHDQPHVLSYRTDGKPVRPAGTGQEQNSTPANATQQRAAAGERKVMAPRREADIGFVHATGEVTPHYEVVQRGQADLAAAWGDVGHNLHLDLSLPKELVVRVHLPGMTSMAGVALDITAHHLQLHIPTRFKLGVPLPFKVDETRGRAKYDKAHQKLEVVLPAAAPMEVASTGDAEPPLGSGQPGLPDIADDFDDAPATVGSATSAGSLSASAAGQCSADATSRLSGSQAADQCLITEGLGYYPDSQPLVKAPFHSAAAGQADSAPTARAVEPADADLSGMNAVAATTRPAVVRLKPRLSSRALAEELD
ncbi:hypothetical protein WJX72_006326 [[Myrmecia] bisecta]|uniref:PIH1 domain-containing protein 1 n=1 Tax=[Myrmecia] bisecta TaxID=41462 RepID=A0AAW1QBJ7_9CHLO